MPKLADASMALTTKIEKCRDLERQIIAMINEISPGDVRGGTSEISDRIRSLDSERAALVIKRRLYRQDLSVLHRFTKNEKSVGASIVESIGRLSETLGEKQ